MNKTTLTVLVIAAVVLSLPVQASAISKGWAAALGFLGGAILADAVCNGPPVVHEQVVVSQPIYTEPVVERVVEVREPEALGHYEWRRRRIWTPGRWVCESDPCGNLFRTWRPGYYRVERYRIWVPHCQRRHFVEPCP
ncbi:MAG: hypothetical protein JXB04_02020 [Kiritimatiellae bacterium]|nr:hypothetical protein [Kiritimatiellia bacterium]